MNYSLKIAAALVMAMGLTGVAHADEGSSEFFHQADGGKWEATPALMYESQKLNGRPSGTQTTNTFDVGAKGEYGIDNSMAAGLVLTYESASTTTTGRAGTTAKGLADPDLYFLWRMPMGPGSFKAGTDLMISMGNATTDSSGNSNAMDGGITLTPYIGYEMAMGQQTFGARLNFDLYKGDQKQSNNSVNSTVTGGAAWALAPFYEYAFDKKCIVGGNLEYTSMAATTTKDAAGNSNGGNNDANTNLQIRVYGAHEIADNITLLPAIAYNTINFSNSASNVSGGNSWSIALGGRFAF